PSGPITSTNRATRDVSGAEESAFHETVLPALPGLLQLSNNILAVEIHQRLPESSDMSFNLELVGTSPDPASFVTIDRPLLVRARAHTGTDWSALAESFLVPNSQPRASSDNLLLTQIHFRPWDQTANEFLVFQNTSSQTIDLSDVRISEAIDFTFAPLTSLAPAESICVIRDAVLFRARYATNTSPYRQNRLKIAGVYEGSLANDGELIRVTDANGQLILQCRYEVNGLWPHLAEGRGAAMVLRDREQAPSTSDSLSAWLSNPLQWRATQEFHGAPGGVTTTQFGPIVINRVLPAPFPPGEDAIELFNIGSQEADISGWFLSDGSGNFKKYQFPEGTRILPQGRKVLLEHEFNTAGALGVLAPFAFDDQGEQLFLMQASPQGDLLRFGDWMEFGPLPRGMAIGRWPDGTGPFRWLSSVNVGTSDARLALGYDAWAATRFPPGTTNSLTSPSGDPDADGILNEAERAFGLDPLSPETSPLQIHRSQPGGLEIRYTIASGSDEWDYCLNVSQDLTQWRYAGNEIASTRQEPRLDGATTVIVMLNQGIPPLFCRLIATQKP
ncbi:MAG: lamin tail domain-containing protein, partial [Verrucomicrobia bacterium]|nr:lamin tail domain-containing protein [Verrucomicrobiota bacterium]